MAYVPSMERRVITANLASTQSNIFQELLNHVWYEISLIINPWYSYLLDNDLYINPEQY